VKVNLLLKHAIHVAAAFAAAATASVLAQQPFQPNLPLFAPPDDVSLRKATILSDGSYTYTPAANYHGSDSFDFTAQTSDDSTNGTVTVTVIDNTDPTITLNGQTPSMWPPNHKYQTFQVTNFVTGASDNCDSSVGLSSVVIEKVTSDELENSGGDGNTFNDIVIAADCKSVQLRSERDGGSNGRVYTITFRVRDASGNTTKATAKVVVPHNNGSTPVDSGVHYTVTSSCP